MSNSPQKKNWSLQDNKRTAAEREAFKPSGKVAKRNMFTYILMVLAITLLTSFTLTVSAKQKMEACLFSGFCFNSKDNVLLYTLYVFSTIFVIVFTVISAYLFAKKIGKQLKK